jgi:hypothetical protein
LPYNLEVRTERQSMPSERISRFEPDVEQNTSLAETFPPPWSHAEEEMANTTGPRTTSSRSSSAPQRSTSSAGQELSHRAHSTLTSLSSSPLQPDGGARTVHQHRHSQRMTRGLLKTMSASNIEAWTWQGEALCSRYGRIRSGAPLPPGEKAHYLRRRSAEKPTYT